MKIGICGTGDISHSFMESAKPVQKIEVSVVYHREPEKAELFASHYGIEFHTDSFNELLNRSDCVYIGLPNSLHYSFSKEAILNKKHVLVEKPMVSNTKELLELTALAKEKGVMIVEVNRVLFTPHFNWIKDKMNDFRLEKMIYLSFCKQSRRYFDYIEGKNPNVFSTKFSGGALYDLGVYGIHFVVGLLGKPNKINYVCHLIESGVDGFGILTLEYDNCIASLQSSKITHGVSRTVIEAVEGRIESNSSVSVLKELTYFDGKNTQRIQEQEYNSFTYFLINAIEMIENQELIRYQEVLEQSMLVLEIMEDARKQNNIIFESDNE